jgi:hypothetical protein
VSSRLSLARRRRELIYFALGCFATWKKTTKDREPPAAIAAVVKLYMKGTHTHDL